MMPPKVEVRFFALTDCTVARRYVPELTRLAAEFRGRVRFVGRTIDAGDPRRWAREFAIPFPVTRDPGGREARSRGIEILPTAVVLRDGKAVYIGRVDDRYPKLGVTRPVTRRDLREAIRDALNGRRVSFPTLRAVGCLMPPP